MEYSDEELSYDPNLFASEVHFCLFNGGVRSRECGDCGDWPKGIRNSSRFWKSRSLNSAELPVKTEMPTVWNLPGACRKWISDRVKFTPPREVATTLAYVVFAVVAVDAVKSRLPWKVMASSLFSGSSMATSDRSSDYDLFALPESKPQFSFSRSNLAARSDSGQARPNSRIRPRIRSMPEVPCPLSRWTMRSTR